MKAVVITQYGPPPDVLQLREVATPEPAEDEILIRLYASSVNPLDGFTIRGPLFFFPKLGGLLKPEHQIPGADFAGRVESVGHNIKRFRTGDEVFGASFTGKGLGGFAEFAAASVAVLCGGEQIVPLAPCRQLLSGDGRFVYLGGELPLDAHLAERATRLAVQAIRTLPHFVGYLGVDLVLGDDSSGLATP